MVANSANLIVTVKPVNQRNNIATRAGGGSTRSSMKSLASYASARSHLSTRDNSTRNHLSTRDHNRDEITHMADSEGCDDDIVKSYLTLTNLSNQTSTAAENVSATV